MSFRLLLLECVLYRTLSVSSSVQVTRNNVYHFHWLVGEWIYSHKPLATCCNAVQFEISFIETLIVLWWQRTCCSSDCGSRVVRKASEGNLETPHRFGGSGGILEEETSDSGSNELGPRGYHGVCRSHSLRPRTEILEPEWNFSTLPRSTD